MFHFLSLPKEVVFSLAEREAKFFYRLMDTQREGGEQKSQRSVLRESELEGGYFAERALQLLKSGKELERKGKDEWASLMFFKKSK